MSGLIKYFEKNKKNPVIFSWDGVILKYNKIWKWIKKSVGAEFDSQPTYDGKYIKTRVKTFEDKAITKFTNNEIPKENPQITHYSCIATICIDSVIKLEDENYPQVNLKHCKFRLKKKLLILLMIN